MRNKKKKNGTDNCNKTRTFHKIAIKAWYVVTEGNGTKRKNQIPGQKLEFYEFQREWEKIFSIWNRRIFWFKIKFYRTIAMKNNRCTSSRIFGVSQYHLRWLWIHICKDIIRLNICYYSLNHNGEYIYIEEYYFRI